MLLFVLTFSVMYLIGIIYLFSINKKGLKNITKLILGIILILSLNIIIWQPAFTTEVIKEIDNNPILLIDNSLSMTQFNSDSTINTLTKNMSKISSLKAFTFGSSIKRGDINNITFNDSTTLFPSEIFNKHKHSPIILISDALFNSIPEDIELSSKNRLYYIPLKRVSYYEYIHFEAPNKIVQKGFKQINLPVTITGHSENILNDMSIEISSNGKSISKKNLTLQRGDYTISQDIPISPQPSGRHIITIKLIRNNKPIQKKEAILYSMPEHQSIHIKNENPSLDSRFLKLAINKRDDLKITTDENADISIIFSNTKRELKTKSGLTLFIGSLLKNSATIPFNKNFIELESNDAHFMEFKTVPAPLKIFKSTNLNQNILTSNINNTLIPILSQNILSDRIDMHLNIQGFWKWDFKDEYTSDLSEFSFTNSLLSHISSNALKSKYKEPQIIHLRSDKFPLTEIFTIYNPLNIPTPKDSVYIYIVNNKGKEAFKRCKSINTLLESDTLMLIESGIDSTTFLFKVKYGKREYSIKKTTAKSKSNTELNPNDQNIYFLDKNFQRIDINNTIQINKLFNNQNTKIKNQTILKQYKLQRNWSVLIITILLFTIIWLIKED